MINIISAIVLRIISNSSLNTFQKILTSSGTKSSVLNFYSYLGLFFVSIFLIPFIQISLSVELIYNFLFMGLLGALGNYFIIKALSLGELSTLAPINSYKPVVALIIGFFYLKEIPSAYALLGIVLIISGTYVLHKAGKTDKTAVFYRILALIFSGTEAVFIKKIILLTNIQTSFILWVVSGLIFSVFFVIPNKHCLKLSSLRNLIFLILSVAIMQYTTNYVFSKINVSYALALFQLSTLLSVFLGFNVFHEKDLLRKIFASLIMLAGAVIIILF